MTGAGDVYRIEYLAYVHAMTGNFGAHREGASKIEYYVNLIG